jgi:hypothetical protein
MMTSRNSPFVMTNILFFAVTNAEDQTFTHTYSIPKLFKGLTYMY